MHSDPRYTTLGALEKLVISSSSGRFRGLNLRFTRPGRILMPCDPVYTNLAGSAKLEISTIPGCFHGL